jgi:hypothetical protein
MEKNETIVKTVKDIFTTYDVNADGYVRNERGNKLTDIHKYIIEELKKIDAVCYPGEGTANLNDCLDYFCNEDNTKKGTWPLKYTWIACYYVTGGSEGYYFHIDMINGNERELLFLGKTLIESRELAAEINAAIANILKV